MWDFNVMLRPASSTPLYLQISRSIADDIRSGRLAPGDPVPGSRQLALQLGVHRNTVMAAYEALSSEGWVRARPAGGTYVSADVPTPSAPPQEGSAQGTDGGQVGFVLPAPPSTSVYPWQQAAGEPPPPLRRDVPALTLTDGAPDISLFPALALGRSYRRVLRDHGTTTLGMDHAAGHPRVRQVLARMLAARRGMVAGADNTFISRGTVMTLRLIAEVLVQPGDLIAVEDPGYPIAWETLHGAGAKLLPIPVDAQGLCVHALERQLRGRAIRAVYVTPHHQYPTTAVMSAGRRLHLLELARRHRFAIIEDDYDHAFHFDGEPIRPIASSDAHGLVIYMASMSKILAPGLRLGFIAAPAAFVARLVDLRRRYDVQGDLTLQLAIAAMAEDGEIARHLRRSRRVYQSRRDALVDHLRAAIGERLDFEVPKGGLSLWLRLRGPVPIEAWAQQCARRGVSFHTLRRFSFAAEDGQAARLCFGNIIEARLAMAVARMAEALWAADAEHASAGGRAWRRA